ncbi:MAG: type I-E CRISPR-associated protein Cse2/CasB [Alphaproteobacteria bacterium]|nr:type I-E CRISPR-associated protein Cse2/CasB [Alphaproteobacteria bacterium]
MSEIDTVVRAVGELKADAARAQRHSGLRASLRRWRPGTPVPLEAVAFAVHLEADIGAPAERLWPLWTALALAAELAEQQADGRALGESLHEAGLSEMRLERLLRATGGTLLGEARRAGRMLAAKNTSVDVVALARLLFNPTDEPRLRVAQSYYRAERASQEPENA